MKLVSGHCAISTNQIESCIQSTIIYYSYIQLDKISFFVILDPNFPPVVNPLRKPPIQLKDDIKAQLNTMVQENVIRPFTELTE